MIAAPASDSQLATCLRTTGSDYSKFLSANLGFRIPSAKIVAESNVDMVNRYIIRKDPSRCV